MRIRYLESLLAVHKYKSYMEAAYQLSLSVSAVSKHVAAVEQELGCRLFSRATKSQSVHVTEAGLRLVPLIKEIVEKYRHLERTAGHLRNERDSRLSIAYIPILGTIGEDEVMSRFCFDHPEIELEQIMAPTREILSLLKAGLVEGAFLLSERDHRSEPRIAAAMEDSDLGAVVLYRSRTLILGVPAGHPAAGLPSVGIDAPELRGECFIFNASHEREHENSLLSSAAGRAYFVQNGRFVRHRYLEFSRRRMVFDTVVNGGGVLPMVVKFEEEYPGLVFVPMEGWNVENQGVFLYRRDAQTKALRLFRRYVEDYAAQHLTP